jgi:OPT family oligopeptide transporter
MMAYPEVPLWWYGGIFVFCFVTGCIGIEIFPTGFPIWALIVSMLLSFVLILPLGIIRAVTNQFVSATFFAELMGGYITPGKPVAFMLLKTYLGWTPEFSLYYLNSMKLGHYMKCPPRLMFIAQTVAVIVSVFVCQGITDAVLNNNVDACTPLSPNGFTCALNQDFVSSAVIWGAIGTPKIFGAGQMYVQSPSKFITID